MLSVIMLSVFMMNVIMLSVIMLSVIMLSVINWVSLYWVSLTECHYTECLYAECHFLLLLQWSPSCLAYYDELDIMISVIVLNAIKLFRYAFIMLGFIYSDCFN